MGSFVFEGVKLHELILQTEIYTAEKSAQWYNALTRNARNLPEGTRRIDKDTAENRPVVFRDISHELWAHRHRKSVRCIQGPLYFRLSEKQVYGLYLMYYGNSNNCVRCL